MKKSAGLLVYRMQKTEWQFFLVHPGGPFWAKKDAGAWSIPKGEFTDEEDPLQAAFREFEEETGIAIKGKPDPLRPVKLKSGKLVLAWSLAGDFDADKIVSNEFTMEWPPRSGQQKSFPEVDRAAWFGVKEAHVAIHPAQAALIDELHQRLSK